MYSSWYACIAMVERQQLGVPDGPQATDSSTGSKRQTMNSSANRRSPFSSLGVQTASLPWMIPLKITPVQSPVGAIRESPLLPFS